MEETGIKYTSRHTNLYSAQALKSFMDHFKLIALLEHLRITRQVHDRILKYLEEEGLRALQESGALDVGIKACEAASNALATADEEVERVKTKLQDLKAK